MPKPPTVRFETTEAEIIPSGLCAFLLPYIEAPGPHPSVQEQFNALIPWHKQLFASIQACEWELKAAVDARMTNPSNDEHARRQHCTWLHIYEQLSKKRKPS